MNRIETRLFVVKTENGAVVHEKQRRHETIAEAAAYVARLRIEEETDPLDKTGAHRALPALYLNGGPVPVDKAGNADMVVIAKLWKEA